METPTKHQKAKKLRNRMAGNHQVYIHQLVNVILELAQ